MKKFATLDPKCALRNNSSNTCSTKNCIWLNILHKRSNVKSIMIKPNKFITGIHERSDWFIMYCQTYRVCWKKKSKIQLHQIQEQTGIYCKINLELELGISFFSVLFFFLWKVGKDSCDIYFIKNFNCSWSNWQVWR